MNDIYQVVVGKAGTVYQGPRRRDARLAFRFYAQLARRPLNRISRENVALLANGELIRQSGGMKRGGDSSPPESQPVGGVDGAETKETA